MSIYYQKVKTTATGVNTHREFQSTFEQPAVSATLKSKTSIPVWSKYSCAAAVVFQEPAEKSITIAECFGPGSPDEGGSGDESRDCFTPAR